MRKQFFNKRMALGVAIALTVTGSLSLLTPPHSENLRANSLFTKNSDFSIIAEASEPLEYTLTKDDVTVDGDTITKYTSAFKTTLRGKITEAAGDSKDLLIKFPEQINGINITKIGDEAFATTIPDQFGVDFDSVFQALDLPLNVKISIKLSDNITSIGKAAFAGSERINHVEFGNSIKTIGDKAFAKCKISGELVLPNTLEAETGIGKYSFSNNEITKLTVPSNVTKIPSAAFGENEILTQVIFNEGLKVIDDEAFFRCAISEPFRLPDTLTELGLNAFNSNKIKKVNLPNALTRIGKQAFMDNKIEEIDWGTYENITNPAPQLGGKVIPFRLFDNNKLKTLNLPTNVSVIGDFAFNSNELTELTIPANIKQIGKNAFYDNKMLHKVKFLTDANGGISKIDESAFAITGIGDHLDLPAGITELGRCAFRHSKIRSVSLEINSADDFPKGTELYQYKGNAIFTENKGWYDGTDLVALYLCQTGSNGTKFITDNKLDDILDDEDYDSNYVINPVLLQFDLNKTGTDLKPNSVELVRKKSGVDQAATTIQNVDAIDYKNYKLGDKIKFKLTGNLPEGYVLATGIDSKTQLTPGADGTYEITLNPDDTKIVQNVSYGDGYELGYKKTLISLVKISDLTKPEPPKTDDKTINGDKDKNKDNTTPKEPPKDNGNKSETKEDSGSKDKKDQAKKDNNDSNNGGSQEVPDRNTPTDTDSTTNQITNPDAIPNDGAVFNLVDENGNPLGKAVLDKDKGTYTIIDDDSRTPQGVAKIHKDNTLEVLKVFDGKTPLGTLPKTGGVNENIFAILGAALISLGILLRKKLK